MILDEILTHKRHEVVQRKARVPLPAVRSLAAAARAPRDFAGALRAPGISLIAEVKFKSPSKGVLRSDCSPLTLADTYARNGARAISVLADEHFFGGGPDVVHAVANAPGLELPVMFKEFIVDPYQVYEARSTGADAVLLIVRAVDQATLQTLLTLTHDLGMQALVEVFQVEEAQRAIEAGARIIGVNNRDLQSFEVSLNRSEEIRTQLPDGVLTVSESGLRSREDVIKAERAGFHAMLVGETLLKATDVGAKTRELLGLGLPDVMLTKESED